MIITLVLYFILSHLFSFFCSIFEAVLLSCTPAYVEVLKKQDDKRGHLLQTLIDQVDKPLAAILTINTISHTFGAAGVGASVLALFGDRYVALGSVILTLTMLYWTEMLPKTLGAIYWRKLAPLFARPIQILIYITAPFVYSFAYLARLLARGKKEEQKITEEDIRGALASGARAGIIRIEEQEMVENIFRLADRTIGMIMIPRVDLIALSLKDDLEKTQQTVFNTQANHYLLCDGEIDEIVGMVESKDILKELWHDQEVSLAKLAKAPTFIHENQRVLDFMELQEATQCSMAIVTDEYGVVQGIVTMNEVIAAIIKDIDESGTAHFHQINSRCWLLDGKMPIDEFKEIFSFKHLPVEEKARYRTLGGLCMTMLGTVPKQGDSVVLGPYHLEVLRTHRRRVEKLLLTKR